MINYGEPTDAQMYKNVLFNFRAHQKIDRCIEINRAEWWLDLIELPEIDKRHSTKYYNQTTTDRPLKRGDVIYNRLSDELKLFCMFEIIQVTSDCLMCKALKPITTIKLLNVGYITKTLIKYKKGVYAEELCPVYININDVDFYYDFNDYIYRTFNNGGRSFIQF